MLEVHGLLRATSQQATVLASHLWDRFRHEKWWLSPKPRTEFLRLLRRYLVTRLDHLKSEFHSPSRDNLEDVFVKLDGLPPQSILDRRFLKDAEFERSLFNFLGSLYRRRSPHARGYSHLERLATNCLRQFRTPLKTLIVNLNYDAFMDHAVARVIRPSDAVSLYGGLINFQLEQGGVRAVRRRAADLRMTVIKPHGSITWWRSRGGEAPEFACTPFEDRFDIPKPGASCFFHRTKWYQPRRWIWPILLPPKRKEQCPGPCRASLRTMSGALEVTREVWLIGWSIPDSDGHLRDEIAAAIRTRKEPIRWLRIIDCPGGERQGLQDKARLLFMPDQIDVHWGGLETWRGWR